MRNIFFFLWLYSCASVSALFAATPPFDASQNRLILITIDGVRWHDVLGKPDPLLGLFDSKPNMPYFQSELLKKGVFIGNRKKESTMDVGNFWSISLPGYFNIFSGQTHDCLNNTCGRIPHATFMERLMDELHLDKKDVATFASWQSIVWAIEHWEGKTWSNVPEIVGGERPDEETYNLAFQYLQKERPRLLYISLNDADARAHRLDYPGYIKSLRTFDARLKELMGMLREMGEIGANTTVIVTTDHGRGRGPMWYEHLFFVPGSSEAWIFAVGPHTPALGEARKTTPHDQLEIRPTIEWLFGLDSWGPGERMTELFFPE